MIGRLLPDGEALAAAVAAELGEPVDAVRPTVRIGMLSRRTRPGSDEEVTAAIEAERARVRTTTVPLPPARLLERPDPGGAARRGRRDSRRPASSTSTTIVAIQRTSGAIAARDDQRLVLILARYGVIRRLSWEACVAEMQAGRLEPVAVAEFARYIMLWNELTSLVVTDGYRAAERDILARDAEARRGALQELLGVVAADAVVDRPAAPGRRSATAWTPTVRIASSRSRRAPRPIPSRSGRGSATRSSTCSRGASATCWDRPPRVRRASGQASACRRSLPMHGRIAVLARADWAGLARVPAVARQRPRWARGVARRSRRSVAEEPAAVAQPQAWVAIGSDGGRRRRCRSPTTYADLVDATRTAQRLGVRGWIPDPERLAVERLLLADRELADAAVRRELGPAPRRRAHGTPSSSRRSRRTSTRARTSREAARRLHLATRTVAYRMERIESLLGYPLDGAAGRRLSTALLIKRLQDA